MTKGKSHGAPEVAVAPAEAARQPQASDVIDQDSSADAISAARIRKAADRSGRLSGKHVHDIDNSSTSSRSRAEKTPQAVSAAHTSTRTGKSKRLTPEAVDRLRTPIGDLDDEYTEAEGSRIEVKRGPLPSDEIEHWKERFIAKHDGKATDTVTRPQLAIKSYNFGHKSGYDRGWEEHAEMIRMHEDGITRTSFRLWQAFAIFLAGTLAGLLLFGIFLSAR